MKITYFIIGYLVLLLCFSACTEEMETVNDSRRKVEVSASMPESGTRASLTQESGSLNLIAKWKEGDKIRLYILQDGKGYSLDPVPIHDISADGKSCMFGFQLPSDVNTESPYEIYGLCDAVGEPLGNENIVLANCKLKRMSWSSYTVPLWFHASGGPSSVYAEFRHLGTYEILHVKNTSTGGVMFRHAGFDVDSPWWKDANIPLSDDYDPSAYVEEPSGDSSGPSVFIPAGQTIDYLSWYIPSGATIKDASLLANIDGKNVSSSNKKSSNVKIQLRHAYHMYATWDGTELKFDNTDVIEGKVIKVEPGKISFGTVPVGTSKTEHLTVSNVGTSSLTFNVRDTHGVMDGVFDIPESGNEYTLAAGESKIFDVNFTPKGVGVHYSWIVPIYSDADNGTETTIISGTGAEGGNPSYPVAEAIDLGLPSGTKWASWNVGASKPEEYGGYYAWGETEEKDYYDWDTYTHCDGSEETCHHIGDDIAGTEYDVAHVKWGGSWRMPTRAQQDELRENCTREWTQQNGVNGSRVTGPNGNSIFLPAAGGRWRYYHNYEGTNGHFWSSSLNSDLEYGACYLGFVTYWWDWGNDRSRSYGNSVRPVCP